MICFNNIFILENDLKIYSQEYVDFIHQLHIDFFIKKNLHETVQHLNEILDISKNKNLYYIIFCSKHFSYEYLNLKEIVKNIYFPDAIIFNNNEQKIEYTVQYKTIFRETPFFNDLQLEFFNSKYDPYFVDKIKLNFIYKKAYDGQNFDHHKYSRFIKTNVMFNNILENQDVINNYLKETLPLQKMNQIKVYKYMTYKFLKYK